MEECGEGRRFMAEAEAECAARGKGSLEGLCSSSPGARRAMCAFKADLPWFILQTQPLWQHLFLLRNARYGPGCRSLRFASFRGHPGGSESHASRLSSFARCKSDVLGLRSTASAVASFLVADGAYGGCYLLLLRT